MRSSYKAAVAIFALGWLLRIMLLVWTSPPAEKTEPLLIAISLAEKGQFADAFAPGTGPSAHSVPGFPILAAAVYKTIGTGRSADWTLSLASAMAISGSFALLPLIAEAAALPLLSGTLAGLGGALLPTSFWSQTSGKHEAPFTAFAFSILLLQFVQVMRKDQALSKNNAVRLGIAGVLGFLFNPTLLLIWAGWMLLLIASNLQKAWRPFFIFAIAPLLVVIGLWTVRNRISLGEWIVSRSNLGLELGVSYNDGAKVSLEENLNDFRHPYSNLEEAALIRRIGEVDYSKSRGEEAKQWIAAHPKQAAQLLASRFLLFWSPKMARGWQRVLETLLSLTALFGAARAFAKHRSTTLLVGAAMLIYPLIYYIVQSSPRYRLPIEPVLWLGVALAIDSLLPRRT
jgi:hypothetical protein